MTVSKPSPELRVKLIAVAEGMWKEFTANVPEAGPVIEAYRKMVGK